MKTIEVYSLPLEDKSNLYFKLWRDALNAYAPQIALKPISSSFFRFAFLEARTSVDARIICIHWSTTLYGSRFAIKSLALVVLNLTALAYAKYVRGFKIVWVVHNAHAHDYSHPLVDRIGRALLGLCTDAFVAQQRLTRDALAERYPPKICEYIPHGNYIGAYGPLADRKAARVKLSFSDKDVVILSFGTMRPYKRNDVIVDAVLAVPNPSLKLFIAGKGDAAHIRMLEKRAENDFRIRIENRFVPDSEIPEYFAAADYGIFYYDDSELTSGAMILTLSYGVPVITRDIASAEMIQEGRSGFVFKSDEELRNILRSKLHLRDEAAQTEALAAVEGNTWAEVARRYAELYQKLVC